MATMDEIPNLLASTFEDSYIGPVTVAPSRILGNSDDDCGNGLFCTDDVSADEVLFLIRPMDDAVISIGHALQDIDCGRDFQKLSDLYEGGETVAMAGWLAKTRICDMLDQAGGNIEKETNEIQTEEDKSRFLCSYISALPWLPENQDHIIWWRQEEADRILGGYSRMGEDDNVSEAMIDEAVRIRMEVASAIPLLADIIGPIVRSKLSMLTPDTVVDLLGVGNMNDGLDIDTDLACNILLSSYLRGAFVILMTRSFDETFEGIGSSSSCGSASEGGRLVPVFDMMQHTTQNPNVYHVYDISSDCIGVMAAQDLKAGEELVISYYMGMDPGVFGTRFGFVPGESQSFRTLLEEKNDVLFSRMKQ